MEQTLVMAALYYFPFETPYQDKQSITTRKYAFQRSLLLFGVAIIIRPTALIILLLTLWVFNPFEFKSMCKHSIKPTLFVLIGSLILDSYSANTLSLSPLNFLYQNVVNGIAKFYGTHPWHWYFTNALPKVTSTFEFCHKSKDLFMISNRIRWVSRWRC